MHDHQYIERFVSLLDDEANTLFSSTVEDAVELLGTGDAEQLRQLDGQFALVHRSGHIVRMARSIGRPMRYFLAKQIEGPCLVVAERIEEIYDWLKSEGFEDQFHPSYTRMVPAHHVVEIALLGCPDPSPTYTRFFTPERNRLSSDLDEIATPTLRRYRTKSPVGWTRFRQPNPSACCFVAVSTVVPCFVQHTTAC